MLYRIYTEKKETTIQGLINLVSSWFDDFTIFDATEFWKGTPEKSVCFEIETPTDIGIIRELIEHIKEYNKQESVLLIVLQCHSEMNGNPKNNCYNWKKSNEQ